MATESHATQRTLVTTRDAARAEADRGRSHPEALSESPGGTAGEGPVTARGTRVPSLHPPAVLRPGVVPAFPQSVTPPGTPALGPCYPESPPVPCHCLAQAVEKRLGATGRCSAGPSPAATKAPLISHHQPWAASGPALLGPRTGRCFHHAEALRPPPPPPRGND